MTDIEWLVDQFINLRMAPEDVRKYLLRQFSEEDVERAYTEFRKRAGTRKYLTPPPMLVRSYKRENEWYPGADNVPDSRFWPSLKNYLLNQKRWSPEAVKSIDDASDKIVAWLESPWAAKIKTRGLVVGYVQSGKTANFTAVIAKAADAGYRFFIVLSGTKKSLRQQTQQRLNHELISLNDDAWYSPTSEQDFRPIGNVNFFLSDKKHDKVLCVVKKNTTILNYLIKWLKGASPDILRQCPFLMIDDEADEASVNTAKNQSADRAPDEADRTAINNHLVTLLRLLPKAAYVGYTATPFANVFIDPRSPDDLYPGDFIVTLPKPLGHFGTDQIFGHARLLDDDTDEEYRGIDMVRFVPEDEIPSLKPRSNDHAFVPEVTASLKQALRYFWTACAARFGRNQAHEHSTMLIHTTQLITVHDTMREQVEIYRSTFLRGLTGQSRDGIINQLRLMWDEERLRVPAESMGETPVSFDELAPYLNDVVKRTVVVADNFKSPNRLSYDGDPKIQIAIGGNTLSRGLTLEGLIVSFFVRAASAYDTLLQMGRWFGYRPGYADLPRIWMTDELAGYFFDLSTIEAEMRRDIENYELMNVTPRQFGLRIRTHPDLNITAPLKMQHVIDAQVSFGDTHTQTVLFEHKDYNWLHQNVSATETFISQLIVNGYVPQNQNGHVLFRDVPSTLVVRFLESYTFHPNHRSLSSKLLRDYIHDQNQHHVLQVWNIVIRGITSVEKLPRGRINIGGLDVPLLQRARRAFPTAHAHIGVLMSKGDTGVDLHLPKEAIKGKSETELKLLRQEQMPGTGLLLIYPIDKDSEPGKGAVKKVNLGAADTVIGLGMVFPEAVGNSRGAQSYVSVDPSKLDQSDLEIDEEEDAAG